MLLPATASGPQADFRRRGAALPDSVRRRPPAHERFDHPWLVTVATVGSLRSFGFVRLPRAGPHVAMPDPPDFDFVIGSRASVSSPRISRVSAGVTVTISPEEIPVTFCCASAFPAATTISMIANA
jgi:hypothetical protein